ncbi:unnamed protein product [Mytilus coruscus]|uniref:Fibrinogen C-terminal domain-containing protein n=1 Tax=Mytilus coruscus TaxID=42192 RepID=A0A6J8DBL5_MYTCO|nr:unnamed protein product [Mytilus coruscus]
MPKGQNGIHTIFPIFKDDGFEVYCDFETDNGNWTVFQRRINGQTDFYRGWNAYENGFGNLKAVFWLGNRKISELTSTGKHELRIDLTDFDGNTRFGNIQRSTLEMGRPITNSQLMDIVGILCGYVNLNGRYLQGGQIDTKGINWYNWKTSWYSMKSSVMMFRKVH